MEFNSIPITHWSQIVNQYEEKTKLNFSYGLKKTSYQQHKTTGYVITLPRDRFKALLSTGCEAATSLVGKRGIRISENNINYMFHCKVINGKHYYSVFEESEFVKGATTVKKIGEGGFGRVIEVVDIAAGFRVATKTSRKADKISNQAIKSEAEILKKLHGEIQSNFLKIKKLLPDNHIPFVMYIDHCIVSSKVLEKGKTLLSDNQFLYIEQGLGSVTEAGNNLIPKINLSEENLVLCCRDILVAVAILEALVEESFNFSSESNPSNLAI